MPFTEPFQPPCLLKGAMVQSVLASSRLRTLGRNPMKAAAQHRTLTSSTGVRLVGAVSPAPQKRPKGAVIILHGWEGGIDSTYVLQTGKHLFNRGYTIYRINLRDHGQTHHLNEGLFFATLIDEAFEAVTQAAAELKDLPLFLVGFSLGGNFALRIARRAEQQPIYGLRHVVAISPVLDPNKATDCIDNQPLLQYYFLRKWTRSLKRKESLFPRRYDFSHVLNLGNVRAITEKLIPRYSNFKSAIDYFQGYAVTGAALLEMSTPTTIITAEDDPVIPIDDFRKLKLNAQTELVIHACGGHNGFIETILLSSWYEGKLSKCFDEIVKKL